MYVPKTYIWRSDMLSCVEQVKRLQIGNITVKRDNIKIVVKMYTKFDVNKDLTLKVNLFWLKQRKVWNKNTYISQLIYIVANW